MIGSRPRQQSTGHVQSEVHLRIPVSVGVAPVESWLSSSFAIRNQTPLALPLRAPLDSDQIREVYKPGERRLFVLGILTLADSIFMTENET